MQSIPIKKRQLLFSFLLALALALASARILTVSSQTPPYPCDTLKLDIQNRAKKDAEADRFNFLNTNKKKKNVNEIVSLYKDKETKYSCSLQNSSWNTWDIYEKEYDIHNPSWMSNFLIFVLSTFFAAALIDYFKKWLTQFLDSLGEWIYQKLAGTSFIQKKALKKYRQSLSNNYQKLRILSSNHYLDMRQVYVPLEVAQAISNKPIDASNKPIDASNKPIDAKDQVYKYRRLMVKGIPGSGKSVFLKYLTLVYAEKESKDNDGVIVPIFLDLNRLNDPDLSEDKLVNYLVEVCDRHDFPKAKLFITKGLKSGYLLLLLDGLDEVISRNRSQVVRCIKDLLEKHKKCRVIITCRTAVYNNEFDDIVDQTLEIIEFSDQQIRRYLKVWQKEMPTDKSVEQLIQTLRDRPKIIALARNPLLLTIIAYLYTYTSFVLPHSRAEFYTKATEDLLEQRDQKRNIPNQYSGVNKRRVLQHLALYAQENANRKHQDRRSFSDQEVWEQVRQVLPSLNLESKDAQAIVDEIVNRSTLLLAIDGGERYQFAHLTLQEYFVAAALRDKPEELIQRWQDAPSDWREIVKLWCGIANNSTILIKAVFQRDPLMAFECLADAQEIDPQVAQTIINYFKAQINQEEEAMIAAFGAVAADFRPRGKELFDFLVDVLAKGESIVSRRVAAKALSMTNLPQAVDRLANYYDPSQPHFEEVRESLIRMGDLATEKLEIIAKEGSEDAMNDLVKIGTPQAAEALKRVANIPSLAYKVSFRLGALLEQLKERQIGRDIN